MGLAIFLFVAIALVSSCNARLSEFETDNPIRLPSLGRKPGKINCQSFRVGVEANNVRNWVTPPDYCRSYIKSYLTGKQYNLDVEGMVIQAVNFAKTTPVPRDLRTNIFVFDLDETLISNLGFFNLSKNEIKPLNHTALYEWIASENSTAPALPAIKYLYDTILSFTIFKPVIISESPQSLSAKRISQLKKAGYDNWDTIIFRGEADNELTNEQFKAKAVRDLLTNGNKLYRVIATVGDQWTDLTIPDAGRRTFKVPNPLYYTA